jgi:hypothetical protein
MNPILVPGAVLMPDEFTRIIMIIRDDLRSNITNNTVDRGSQFPNANGSTHEVIVTDSMRYQAEIDASNDVISLDFGNVFDNESGVGDFDIDREYDFYDGESGIEDAENENEWDLW